MKKHQLICFIMVSVLSFTVFISCEKNNEEILNAKFKKVYGEWTSDKRCGGFSGGCVSYEGEILNIIENNKFEISNNQSEYAKGYITVVSQDSINLKIKLETKKGKLRLFSYDELSVTFMGDDTIIFDEGCCDRWSFQFIREK